MTGRPPAILSIQSTVAYGHVGNSATVFPLQRLGFEVWPVITVHFSNHTGYGAWRGPVLAPEAVADVLAGIEERGVFPGCSAVLSGYMGDATLGAVILDAVARVRAVAPGALYCCDPVMGDVGRGFFVRPGIPEFMRDRAVPAADVITPNQFELEWLTGHRCDTLAAALDAAAAARAMGPDIVVITSLERRDGAPDTIEMLAVSGAGAWLVATPRLPISVNGAGDLTAGLFLAELLRLGAVPDALAATASAVFAVLDETHRAGAREIQIVAAQDALVTPPRRFEATRVG
jgi:pyridoxine kinase